MNWDEIKRAFKEKRKVRINVGGKWIECLRLEEIGIKRVGDGSMYVAVGLDKNNDCLYCGKIEDFEEI